MTRRKLLSVVCLIRHFHNFLYGAHFDVVTDHGSLKWLMNFNKNCEGQLARWLEILGQYDFTIRYRPGKVSLNSDALSRRPCTIDRCRYCTRPEEIYLESCDYVMTDMKTLQTEDTLVSDIQPVCSTEADQTPGCSTKDNCIEDLQNLSEFQENDIKLSLIKQWVRENKKPTWQDIARYNNEVKYYWQNFDRLKLVDNQLCISDDPNLLKPNRTVGIIPHKLR